MVRESRREVSRRTRIYLSAFVSSTCVGVLQYISGDRAERWGAFVMPGLDRVDLEDELRVLDGCANLHAMRRSAPHGVIPVCDRHLSWTRSIEQSVLQLSLCFARPCLPSTTLSLFRCLVFRSCESSCALDLLFFLTHFVFSYKIKSSSSPLPGMGVHRGGWTEHTCLMCEIS